MISEHTFFEKKTEPCDEMAAAFYITRRRISAALLDMQRRRVISHIVRFGAELNAENVTDIASELTMRLLRESGAAASCIKKAGFAAPADITLMLEEFFTPSGLYLPPTAETVILPIISASLGGDFSGIIAAAMTKGGSFLTADVTDGFRAAKSDGGLRVFGLPLSGGLDGSGLENGMSLEQGAIDTVQKEQDGTILYSVVGDGDSIGIAPTAAAGCIQIMLEQGSLDSDGIMTDRDLFFIGEDFYLSQQDVRIFQSDKASCRAALELIGKVGDTPDRAVISGEAFGNLQGAQLMGRLGAVPAGLARSVVWSRLPGETGLAACLSSPDLTERLCELCGSAEDISDSVLGEFDGLYYRNLSFPG